MSKLRCHISVSADGFVAGPGESMESPLGEGGERLHDWAVALAAWRASHGMTGGEVNASTPILEGTTDDIGAGVMGRNMFGPPGGGDWGDGGWTGWWGDDPPYHNDVFVLTHHPREALAMEGGTTFHFVTDGIEADPRGRGPRGHARQVPGGRMKLAPMDAPTRSIGRRPGSVLRA